ncbi:MAG: serine/threonine-protein phosphatase [Bacteroides sp.]|nr:serine/threonine-protein phosphatase [Bacteroides sp.]MBD5305952.1 serine/threonine-protein phosphatase [Bacteroides sp.]
MKYKLKVYSIWEYGQRKDSQGNPHQEDNMFPESGKQSEDDRLFILCDGMGGHDAGEVASATVCEAMSQSILNDGHDKEGIFTPEDFSNALNAAFDALDKKDNGAEKKMGTTMTFLKLYEKGVFIAHMGDSRVYQIRPGKTGEETQIVFQTEDHSLVNDFIKIGELTKEEARFSKQKNVITRAMQPNMGRRPKADIYETSDIKGGDYFYMCTDGMLEQDEMENGESLKNIFSEMGGSDENKVEILKSVTEKNRDNHTAFIIHILEVEEPIQDTITENTSMQILGDKFTAIVEEAEKTESNSENEQNELTRNQDTTEEEEGLLQPKKNDSIPTEKIESKPQSLLEISNKRLAARNTLYSNIMKFLGVAIIVLLVIIGFNYFRSCSKVCM